MEFRLLCGMFRMSEGFEYTLFRAEPAGFHMRNCVRNSVHCEPSYFLRISSNRNPVHPRKTVWLFANVFFYCQ